MVRPNKRRRPARTAYSTSAEGSSAQLPLRLAVTKGGLGLELDRPLSAGLLDVEKLSVLLVGLSFPVDLSGGVSRFRHRRGALEHLALAAKLERATAALAPLMRGTLARSTPALTLAPISGGVMVGLVSGAQALAFDLLWAPSETNARFVITGARALGLATPAVAAALRAMDGVARAAGGSRSGALLSFDNAAQALARTVLPPLGARAPEARDARWGLLEWDGGAVRVRCDRAYSPPVIAPHVVRELELARLAERSDHALAGGSLEEARDGYVALLERSPRDGDLARRLADLDRAAGGRNDAALATLLEWMPAAEAGLLAADLLEATRDRQGAVRAFRQAADREIYGPLAALALLRASEQADDPRERADLLDRAVARAPALEGPRWARFATRLRAADLHGALGDAEHLEAAARGAHARHEVWRRSADALLREGHHASAVTLFERALRYLPDSPRAVAGLARSLMAAGRGGRALDLLARAVELADRDDVPAYDVVLALARALADSAGDYPHAIARLRTIPPGHAETLDARGLEARYRAALGDVAGASMAFVTMRDHIELTPTIADDRAAAWLVEAARYEKETTGDLRAAERHLTVALKLVPHDARVIAAFRQIAGQAAVLRAEGRRGPQPADPAREPAQVATPPEEQMARNPPEEQMARDEARVQMLSDRLRGDPTNLAVALELSDLLARAGRDLEVFALLSGQLEDAPEEHRAKLAPRQIAVLERLIQSTHETGQASEHELFVSALAALRGQR